MYDNFVWGVNKMIKYNFKFKEKLGAKFFWMGIVWGFAILLSAGLALPFATMYFAQTFIENVEIIKG